MDSLVSEEGDIMIKTVILIGGPSKGTRFRPLSLDLPKPLFPIAGLPMIQHHIEAAVKVDNMKEILLIGSYQPNNHLTKFINNMQSTYKVVLRYLQEFETLGTAGGLYHFRDQVLHGNPEAIFVMNADVCGEFPLSEMLQFHRSNVASGSGDGGGDNFTIMATEATRQQSLNYGCIVQNDKHQVLHYVEKPETFVSHLISCGVYIFSAAIFTHISTHFKKHNTEISFDVHSSTRLNSSVIRLEQDLFSTTLPETGKFFVYQTSNFWSQVKSAGATIYANRNYLKIYQRTHPQRLAPHSSPQSTSPPSPTIIGDVFISPDATIHHTAVLGPNVSIGKGCNIGPGVRLRESIVLDGAVVKNHSCILYTIVGWGSVVGEWARIEGTPTDPNPNKPFTKLDIGDLFNSDGRLNPSITVIGSNVQVPSEVVILNSIVLPDKEIHRSFKNQIIL